MPSCLVRLAPLVWCRQAEKVTRGKGRKSKAESESMASPGRSTKRQRVQKGSADANGAQQVQHVCSALLTAAPRMTAHMESRIGIHRLSLHDCSIVALGVRRLEGPSASLMINCMLLYSVSTLTRLTLLKSAAARVNVLMHIGMMCRWTWRRSCLRTKQQHAMLSCFQHR